jgi:hypothetical protein
VLAYYALSGLEDELINGMMDSLMLNQQFGLQLN